jgi:hypothetical protein
MEFTGREVVLRHGGEAQGGGRRQGDAKATAYAYIQGNPRQQAKDIVAYLQTNLKCGEATAWRALRDLREAGRVRSDRGVYVPA